MRDVVLAFPNSPSTHYLGGSSALMPWWLWSAWAVSPGGAPRPVYGLLAGTTWSNTLTDPDPVALPSGATLKISQRLLGEAEAAPLRRAMEQHADEINLSAHCPGSPPVPLRLHRRIIAEAFGHSAAIVDCGYGLPESGALFSASEDIGPVIGACTEHLGLPFRGEFAAHLGGFDLFHLGPWLDAPSPFRSESVKGAPDVFRIWRHAFKDARHVVHLTTRGDGEVVLDQLFSFKPGPDRLDIPLPGPTDGYELRIFGHADGALVHKEAGNFIREVDLGMARPVRTMLHSDRLSRTARAHGAVAARRAGSTTVVDTMRSRVTSGRDGMREHVQAMRAVLDEHLGEPSDDRWFPRTFEAQLDVIDHLNRLLDDGQTREAVLVDPFFGEEALQRLALRLTQTGLSLVVVTSWGRTDPDTGAPVKGGSAAALAEAERRLKPLLARIGSQIAPSFRLVNLVTGSGSQAFHDRYLLLRPHSGAFRVFLLSNSINNAAANWPFCMSLLGGRARLEARRYIEGLVEGRDVTGSTNPRISFEWPTPVASAAPPA